MAGFGGPGPKPDIGVQAKSTLENSAQGAEATVILRRRDANLAVEQAAEEAGVFVADLTGDRLDRQILCLQHLLRLFQPERMDVVQRRHAGGLAEATGGPAPAGSGFAEIAS